MRRALLLCGLFAVVGCGISAVASMDGPGSGPDDDSGSGVHLTETGAPDDANANVGDADLDGGMDAIGVGFSPSHLAATDFTLESTPVVISDVTTIDTTALTVALNNGPAQPLLVAQGPKIAVWSVGPLTLNLLGDITVTGDRALVIVVNGDFTSNNTIKAGAVFDAKTADDDKPGPGGNVPGTATAGGAGQTTKAGQAGGGGGGSAVNGAAGGQSPVGGTGGGAGGLAIPTTDLVGGRAGGNGGGFNPGSLCSQGGNGGGAIQLSVKGNVTFATGSIIDVSGGGGHGGCKQGSGSGGGGGGGGGLIWIEATGNISQPLLTGVVASGGGGGQGADDGTDGAPGETPDFYTMHAAAGGKGSAAGGNGGAGGYVANIDAGVTSPVVGDDDDVAGGGGGAPGTVYYLTRGTFTGGGAMQANVKVGPF